MDSLSKQIYDFMERLLQVSRYRLLLVENNNNILNYLILAHHEAFCVEVKRKYGDMNE